MRTNLLTTGLAALLITATMPVLAAGPGRGDHDTPAQTRYIPLPVDHDQVRRDRNQWHDDDWRRPPYGYPGYGNSPYGNGWSHRWGNDNRWGQGWGNGNGWGNSRRLLPNHVVRAQLERQRFHDFSDWKYKDGYYKVYAEDRNGRDVKLVIDPYTGRIVDLKRR